jgi:hypothetical protein
MPNPIYYNENQIKTGLYTSGNELLNPDGSDYVGPYHRYPNDTFWKGFNPEELPIQLFRKNKIVPDNDLTRLFKKDLAKKISNYLEPVPYYPIVDDYVKTLGQIERYFVTSVDLADAKIIEIDIQQYLSINSTNVEGIDAARWKGGWLTWYLSPEIAKLKNLKEIQILNKRIPGINYYLQNIMELTI